MSFESGTSIQPYTLVDKKMGIEINVTDQTAYTFTGSVTDAADRFELYFKRDSDNKVSTSINKGYNTEHGAFVSSCPGGMFVSLTNVSEKEYTIEMVRSGGRIIETFTKQINTSSSYGEYIELSHLTPGSYVVKLTIGDTVSTFHVDTL